MVKIGIAGYGFMGRFHHTAYGKCEGARVSAVFDVNPDVLRQGPTQGNIGTAEADSSKVQLFTGYDAFLKEVEVVDICTPTPFHVEQAVKALHAGKHVLLEKPMALTEKDCEKILEAASKAEGTFMVAHCVRFWPGYDLLIEASRDKRYGRLRSVSFSRFSGSAFWSSWFLSEDKCGGAVVDMLVHDFDMCRVLGGMPEGVHAAGTVDGLGEHTGVNYVDALLRFPGEEAASLAVKGGWLPSSEFPFSQGYLAQFEEATLSFDSGKEKPLTVYPGNGKAYNPELAAGDGYEAELRYFLSVLGSEPERCLPREAYESVRIALAAARSVRSGREVQL